MTRQLIEKKVDIDAYPETVEKSRGSLTGGDMHGSALRLARILFGFHVLKFNDNVLDPKEAYKRFADLYEKSGDIGLSISDLSISIKTTSKLIEAHQRDIARYHQLSKMDSRNEAEAKELAAIDPTSLQGWLDSANANKADAERQLELATREMPEILNKFNGFIDQLEVADKEILLRLIGDELADRGSNDYFTLRLLDFLQRNGVKVTITISNHSNDFVRAYERLLEHGDFNTDGDVSRAQKPSLIGLKALYDNQLVSKQDIAELVERAYKPCLKILDYSLNEQGITLFTHAPVSFAVISDVAKKLGVVYRDSTKEALAETIDKINTQFAIIVKENRVHEYCDEGIASLENMTPQEIKDWPLAHLMWNRWNQSKDKAKGSGEYTRPKLVNNYSVGYVHGHDSYRSKDETQNHVINLDTPFGKFTRKDRVKKIEEMQKIVDHRNESSKNKALAQNVIDEIDLLMVLDSDEISLNQLLHQASLRRKRAGIFAGIFAAVGLLIGAGIGAALVATGVFAPLGLGLLGIIGFAAITGGGLAFIGGALGVGVAKATAVQRKAVGHLEGRPGTPPPEPDPAPEILGSTPAMLQKLGGSLEVADSNSSEIRKENSTEVTEDQKQVREQAKTEPKI